MPDHVPHLYSFGAQLGTGHSLRLSGTVDSFTVAPGTLLPILRRRAPVVDGRQRKTWCKEVLPVERIRLGDRIGFASPGEFRGTARNFMATLGDPVHITRGGHSTARYAKPEHEAVSGRTVDLTGHAESPSLWFLAGAYLGDGYRRTSNYETCFCVGAHDSVKAVRVREALADVGLTGIFEDRYGGASNVKLRVHARHLSMFLGAFGDGADGKLMPRELAYLERPLLDALIDGHRVTDGSSNPARRDASGKLFSARWRIASVSLPLLVGLQRLLLRRREYGQISRSWPGGPQVIMGRQCETKPRWEITVSETTRRGCHEFDDAGSIWVRVNEKAEPALSTDAVWVQPEAEASCGT
jgi:hypothetical protein